MTPDQVASSYDQLAEQWLDLSTYGFVAVERAIAFVKHKQVALDVGCGTGRLMSLLSRYGFEMDGVDLSAAMLTLARSLHPEAKFYQADITQWELPRRYDLILAWDSIWHVPLQLQAGVVIKLAAGLKVGGVFVLTMGGTDAPEEKKDSNMGVPMYHATPGIPRMLRLLDQADCVCRHLEYDQYPESHVYLIAQKSG